MSDPTENTESYSEKQPEPRVVHNPTPKPRHALRFVLTFTICVFAILLGYRYAIPTKANARYLYDVATHSSFVLNMVGESCVVERTDNVSDKDVRVAIEALERGEKPTTQLRSSTQLAPEEQATAWHIWYYRFLLAKVSNRDISTQGPLVFFVNSPKQRFMFRLVPDCGAIPSMAIFLAAVLAFPAAFRRRLMGVFVGLPILYIVNVFRVTCLAYVGAVDESKELFQFLHVYVWQGVYVIFVVAVWLAWIEFIVRRKPTDG